jgi:hypothetical protein
MIRRSSIVIALLLSLGSAPAWAHVGEQGPISTVTQQLGTREVTIRFELPPFAPGAVRLTISSDAAMPWTLRASAVPSGLSAPPAPMTQRQLRPAEVVTIDLPVDQAGRWELLLDDGSAAARVPFVIAALQLAPGDAQLAGALIALLLTLLLGMVVAALGRTPGEWLARGQVAALTAVVIIGAQQWAQRSAAPPPAGGRPHAVMTLHTAPAALLAGQPTQLQLTFIDGATGLMADDIEVHHEAYVHLVILDDAEQSFSHIHPARTAPGRYQVAWTPPAPGDYTVYAEIVRHGGGASVLSRRLTVVGAARPRTPPPMLPLSSATPAGVQIALTAAPLDLGRPTVITVQARDAAGTPAAIRTWLGMAGHLVVRSADRQIYAHVHAMPSTDADGTVRFVYQFPGPGEYQLHAQLALDGGVTTISGTLAMPEGADAPQP